MVNEIVNHDSSKPLILLRNSFSAPLLTRRCDRLIIPHLISEVLGGAVPVRGGKKNSRNTKSNRGKGRIM
jgi:hypothetical protein